MTTSRRGFLKLLTKAAAAIAAAPAVDALTKFIPAAPELDAAYSHLASFDKLLQESLSDSLLIEELLKPNWLLTALKKPKSEFTGTTILVPFTQDKE